MRRVLKGLAAVAVVVFATAILATLTTRAAGDHVPTKVLSASIERHNLSDWAEQLSAGATRSTTTSPTSTSTLPSPTSAPTTLPQAPTTTTEAPPLATIPPVVPPPDVMSADGAAAATATSPVTPPQPSTGVDVVDRAEQLVHFDWRDALPGWTIQFAGQRAGMRGATFPAQRVVQVYVRQGESAADVAHAFAHELGHAIDVTYMNDQVRAEFNQARGRSATFGWWVAPGADDFASGAGDWAECFAWTMTNGVGGFYSKLGPPPDSSVMALIGQLDH
jgi:hypothetical protein